MPVWPTAGVLACDIYLFLVCTCFWPKSAQGVPDVGYNPVQYVMFAFPGHLPSVLPPCLSIVAWGILYSLLRLVLFSFPFFIGFISLYVIFWMFLFFSF